MKGETMPDMVNMEAVVQIADAWKGRQEILANGDQALAAQEAAKAENAAILQVQVTQIATNRQHLDELDEALARRRGELLAVERDADVLGRLRWEQRGIYRMSCKT
jgi:hypothetical protein